MSDLYAQTLKGTKVLILLCAPAPQRDKIAELLNTLLGSLRVELCTLFSKLTRLCPQARPAAFCFAKLFLARFPAAQTFDFHAFVKTSAPVSTNSRAFSSMPFLRASSSERFWAAAYLRTSSEIFMEQKWGPHMEQKWADLAPS